MYARRTRSPTHRAAFAALLVHSRSWTAKPVQAPHLNSQRVKTSTRSCRASLSREITLGHPRFATVGHGKLDRAAAPRSGPLSFAQTMQNCISCSLRLEDLNVHPLPRKGNKKKKQPPILPLSFPSPFSAPPHSSTLQAPCLTLISSLMPPSSPRICRAPCRRASGCARSRRETLTRAS